MQTFRLTGLDRREDKSSPRLLPSWIRKGIDNLIISHLIRSSSSKISSCKIGDPPLASEDLFFHERQEAFPHLMTAVLGVFKPREYVLFFVLIGVLCSKTAFSQKPQVLKSFDGVHIIKKSAVDFPSFFSTASFPVNMSAVFVKRTADWERLVAGDQI